jgi:ABC-type antimicrobial peptide transport system permease subunit
MSRALSSLVFGISVWDPLTYAGVLALLAAIALVACLVPALRASRVDPMQALRLD